MGTHFLDLCNICDANPANPADPGGNCDECLATADQTTFVVTVDHPHAALEASLLLRMVGIETHGDRDSNGFTVANDDVDDAFKVLAGVGGVLTITGRPA